MDINEHFDDDEFNKFIENIIEKLVKDRKSSYFESLKVDFIKDQVIIDYNKKRV